MSTMDNLHGKGWLQRERNGKAYRYWPTGPVSSTGPADARCADAGGRSVGSQSLIEQPARRKLNGCVPNCGG